MASLIAAALCFAALHLLVSGTRVRDGLVQRLGERAYRGLFSAASAVLLGWLIVAYVRARQPQVSPLFEYRGVAAALVFIAFVFMLSGLLTPSPGIVGGEKLLAKGHTPSGIHRITRHPFLWGIALWGAVHAAFNATAPHLVFFGTFVIVALLGTASIDAKRARVLGAAWEGYVRQTSNLPFAAIAQGRNRLAWGELGLWKIAIAIVGYAGFLYFHGRLFGVPLA